MCVTQICHFSMKYQAAKMHRARRQDLLIPLTQLSEAHVNEALRTERAGHQRCNKRRGRRTYVWSTLGRFWLTHVDPIFFGK